MNKSRSENTTKPKPIIVEDALRHLTSGIGQLDGGRAAAYGELSTLRSAKQGSLQRREKIYAVKYGANDRRVVQTQKLQENNTRLRQEIYVAHTQAATPAPAVDENGYVFHGFVRDGQKRPLSRLTVALYDEKGQWLRELGYGCTDETGYFLLRFSRDTKGDTKTDKEAERKAAAEEAAKLAAEKEAAEKKAAAGEKPAEAEAPASRSAKTAYTAAMNRIQTGTRDVYTGTETRGKKAEIRVYDAKQTLLHREAEPLTPKLGAIDYREITIDSGGTCVPPPGATDDPPPAAPAKPAQTPRVPAPMPSQPAAATATPRPPAEKPAAPAPTPQDRASTPLENIKGVGPKTAAKLRATGIKDVEALKETKTEKLVELAGTDKKVTDAAKPKTKTKAVRAKAATTTKKKTPPR